MAVENVFKPKTVNPMDPKVASEKKEGDKNYWEQKRDEAKARLDYEEYVTAMKKLGETPEPAFKVTGAVNLGNIDLQEQQRQAQERTDKVIQGKDDELKTERGRANKAEQELQDQKIETLRQDFDHKMDALNKTIENLATSKQKDNRPFYETFKEQWTGVQEVAKALGLEKTSTGRDPMVEIELAKMSYQQSKGDQEFKWKIHQDEKQTELERKRDDRQYQLDQQKAQTDHEFRQKELDQKAKRDETLFTLPQTIGAAIAKGIAESAKGVAASPESISQESTGKKYQFEVPEGGGGTTECPNCHAPVGIGPTTILAECVQCHGQYKVVRTPAAEKVAESLPAKEEE